MAINMFMAHAIRTWALGVMLVHRIGDYDAISKLQYHRMVLKETLRLYPSAPLRGRSLTEPVTLAWCGTRQQSCKWMRRIPNWLFRSLPLFIPITAARNCPKSATSYWISTRCTATRPSSPIRRFGRYTQQCD